MIHGETPPYKNMEPFDAFMLDWDTRNNNEPFWARSHEIDLEKLSKKGGFHPKNQFETLITKCTASRRGKKIKGVPRRRLRWGEVSGLFMET